MISGIVVLRADELLRRHLGAPETQLRTAPAKTQREILDGAPESAAFNRDEPAGTSYGPPDGAITSPRSPGSMKTMIAMSAVAVALEARAQPYIEAALGSRLPAPTALSLPAAYAGVVLVNVVAASFALIKLGMAVGKARKTYNVEVRCLQQSNLRSNLPQVTPHRR